MNDQDDLEAYIEEQDAAFHAHLRAAQLRAIAAMDEADDGRHQRAKSNEWEQQ